MADEHIYRVIVKSTGSLQPSGTFWDFRTVYCGSSLLSARVAYLREEAADRGGSYGNPSRETTIAQHEIKPDDISTTDAEELNANP